MQGKQTVIDVLNAGLTIELTAINQYFVQSKMCRNWGLNRLAAKGGRGSRNGPAHGTVSHPPSPVNRRKPRTPSRRAS